ncbi:hypothetical protein ACJW30_02G214000 [Castanea mollissima]
MADKEKSKHYIRRWRKSSVLRHPLTLGHVDNLIKSNKTLPSHPNPRHSAQEKQRKQKKAHSRLCFLPPPPQPGRRSRPQTKPDRRSRPQTKAHAFRTASFTQKFLVSSASSLFHLLLPLAQISTTPHTEAYRHTSHRILS